MGITVVMRIGLKRVMPHGHSCYVILVYLMPIAYKALMPIGHGLSSSV
jgi:hypothetical protein